MRERTKEEHGDGGEGVGNDAQHTAPVNGARGDRKGDNAFARYVKNVQLSELSRAAAVPS